MPLTLEIRTTTTAPISLVEVTPAALEKLSTSAVERLPIQHGNCRTPLGELFKVSGSAADGEIRFVGNLAGVHWIGARMERGTVQVEGDAGRHLGSQMGGGVICVSGSAGDYAGVEMRGGQIHVLGSVGEQAGGTYPGSRRGMRGGALLIDGNAGAELGRSMRRGLIAVGGSTEAAPGYDMIAGTIVIGGECGRWPGGGMRRGTLIACCEPPELLPTFRWACRQSPVFLQLLRGELLRRGFAKVDELLSRQEWDVYNGDLTTIGKGEILARAR
jgi:formylmethanofuran dehydrogenase subunit C